MVTADRSRLLRRSLLSFGNQTYENKELIIVDDGKEDLSPLFEGMPAAQITYLKLERKEHHVLGYLRNVSLDSASGEYITQWDDDDWYHPDRIRLQADVLMKGFDMCCLSHALMHLDVPAFREHPYLAFFKSGVPGSIMHRRNPGIRYPELARGEDDIYLKAWKKESNFQLDSTFAPLFIRCYHGNNTWDMKHFLEQMRNTLPDLMGFGWHRFIQGNVLKHRRFRLDEKARSSFALFLEDSRKVGVFPSCDEPCE